MNDKVVIAGTVKLRNTIKAKTNLHNVINGTPSWVINAGGGVTPSGTIEITENGVYNVTEYASADVDVQGGITPTGTKQINIASNGTTTEDVTSYANAEINVNVPASAVDTGTKSINSNGTHDVVGYANASVNVPNSYSASDEGKVVSNGALVSQTSDTVTANDTYDTTLINSLTVNVSGGGGATADEIAMRTKLSGDVTLASATEIKPYAFYGMPITSINAPYVTKIDGLSLGGTLIEELDDPFPSMTPSTSTLVNTASGNIFGNMTALKRVYMTNTGSWCCRLDTFKNCINMVVLRLPNQTADTDQRVIQNSSKLKVVDWGESRIHINAFNNCTAFQTLILRKSSVQTLNNISAFTDTPFRGKGGLSGTVYCPQSLISSYQTATNWSTLYSGGYCTFVKLEGSPYEQIDWDDSSFFQ